MPNYCNNRLILTGENNILKNFINDNYENEDQCLSFNKLVPLPEEEKDNWYEWQTNNWGTKWDSCDSTFVVENNKLIYEFNTAWGPPNEWFKKIYNKYEIDMILLYYEPGCDFAGCYEKINDEINELDFNTNELCKYHIELNIIDFVDEIINNVIDTDIIFIDELLKYINNKNILNDFDFFEEFEDICNTIYMIDLDTVEKFREKHYVYGYHNNLDNVNLDTNLFNNLLENINYNLYNNTHRFIIDIIKNVINKYNIYIDKNKNDTKFNKIIPIRNELNNILNDDIVFTIENKLLNDIEYVHNYIMEHN